MKRRAATSAPFFALSALALASGTPSATPIPTPLKKQALEAPDDTPAPTRPGREAWHIGVENAEVAYRAPRKVLFVPLPRDREVPDGTQLRIRIPTGSKGRVRIVHKGGRMIEATTTVLLRLLASELAPPGRPFRIALEDLPSNIGSDEDQKKLKAESDLDRIIAFFVPRVPVANAVEPPRLAKKPWLQNPIRPTYPGPVHLVEAEVVPVVVNFEWPVQGGQQEPHAFYLWMSDRFVQAPQAIVRGGRVSVTLSNFGKYFWQVEDRTGQFVSSPRIVYVRRPGESLEDGAKPTPTPTPTGSPSPDDEKNVSFQLASPRKKSVITVCLGAGREALFPLRLPNAVTEAKRYVVEAKPAIGDGRWVFERTDDRKAFEAAVPVTRAGNVTFTLKAEFDGGKEMQGDETPVRIVDVCAKGADPKGAFQGYLSGVVNERIPESGALYLLPEGDSP